MTGTAWKLQRNEESSITGVSNITGPFKRNIRFLWILVPLEAHRPVITMGPDSKRALLVKLTLDSLWRLTSGYPCRFLAGDDAKADARRNSIFKLIPSVAKGSWVIKQSVGHTPVLLGKKLTTHYHRCVVHLAPPSLLLCTALPISPSAAWQS